MITTLKSSLAVLVLLSPALSQHPVDRSVAAHAPPLSTPVETQEAKSEAAKERTMLIQYLEVVSSDVDATCDLLAKVHGVAFAEPEPGLANARTATLKGGGRIGVRAPMAEHDVQIVRPYVLVDNTEAAVKIAEGAGGEFAMRATEIPGQGKFAIYFSGGAQFGLWNLPASKGTTGEETKEASKQDTLKVQYLEVVSSDVEATCRVLAKAHGVTFGEPDATLGNARTASLKTGGMIGVRASMAAHDKPIVRPYMLVEDIEAAIEIAEANGAKFAMKATPIPGHGKFAIYFVNDIQFGLWETSASKTSR